MAIRNHKDWYKVIGVGLCLLVLGGNASYVAAANISDFVTFTPYVEVQGGYDNNVFEIADDAALPAKGKERKDLFFDARVGLGADIKLERPYLTLGCRLNYNFEYLKYNKNTELDDTSNNLDFNLIFNSKYEEGIIKDRLKFNIKDVLSLIPIDENEPLYAGNQAIRNDFTVGGDYKLISARRVSLTLGYAYGRVDFFKKGNIEVQTVTGFKNSDELTQKSQTHTGKAEFKYIMNPRMTYTLTYTYGYTLREENPGELVSANFARQNVLGGLQAQFTPKIQGNFQAGYGWTMFQDVGNLSQPDQNNFIAETSLTANFAHQPLVTVGYRKYFTENDFGDTLLTDNIFGRLGFKVAKDFLVNFSGDYILENRALMDDESTQTKFGVSTEYDLWKGGSGFLKGLKLLGGYDYNKKKFFAHNFLAVNDRKETDQVFSGGVECKLGRYVLLKGLYSYTDRTSNIAVQEFSRNKFIVSGKVMF
jgi:hypothetical protein